MVYKLVLLRHGETEFNNENRFTGWLDLPLNEAGKREARTAAQLLHQAGIIHAHIFTSLLQRAIVSTEIIVQELDCDDIAIDKTWRLNERHYGALQGQHKVEAAQQYGLDQVALWRRSYLERPPSFNSSLGRNPADDPMYAELEYRPTTESLYDVEMRLRPLWHEKIKTALLHGDVLVVGHSNSLRALVKLVEELSAEEIFEVNLPTCVPIVYELDNNCHFKQKYFLGDVAVAHARAEAVAQQASIQPST